MTEPLWREAQRQFAALNGSENVQALRAGLADMVVGDASLPSDE
jgi:hypothetical protein